MFRLAVITSIFCFLFDAPCACAQAQGPDSMCLHESVTPFLDLSYNQPFINLYTGSEYIGTYPGTKGSAYYEWDTLQQGSIKYNGICYPNIWLKYDLVQNAIVVTGKQNLAVALVPEKIDLFSIQNHRFVHITQPNGYLPAPEGGFYEVLYSDDSTSVLAQRTKKIERGSSVEDPYVFKQYNTYFVKNGSSYQLINNEKELLNVFANQKEKMKQFVRGSKLDFKRNKEQSILKAVAYYNTL